MIVAHATAQSGFVESLVRAAPSRSVMLGTADCVRVLLLLLRTCSQTIQALKAAGFEVLEYCDLATTADIPWWDPVDPDNWHRLQSELRCTVPGSSQYMYAT